jgi:hypothetical protein
MIKTFDLRIGNFITVSEVTYRVTGISETKVHCKGYKGSFNQEAVQPIGLTHEILQKAGFKQRGITDLYYKVPEEGFIYKLSSSRVMIFHAGENTLYHSLYTYMPSLHQLQNFYYCLTGREIAVQF